MIFLETIFFFIFLCFLSMSLAGFGKIITYKFKNSFFENIFVGFVMLSFLITLIHFFFNISFLLSFLILCSGFLLFILNKEKALKNIFIKKNIFYFLIIIFLTPIFLSQKYHEDFGYYHLPYVIALIEDKIIFGLANSNDAYIYNSIWLNLMSIFVLPGKNFNFLTLPAFLLYITFVIFLLRNILEIKKKVVSNYFIIVSLFYFILKFTRISEFGTDLPATLFSILSIFYFLKFSEVKNWNTKSYYFFCNFIFVIFAILIKLSCIPLLLLTGHMFISNYNKIKNDIFKFNYIFVYFLCLLFFMQQFFYSGCFFFPSTLTCLKVSWFSNEFLLLKNNLELINKSYVEAQNIYSKEDYLNNFTWFSYWLERNYIEILEHIITMIFPLILLFFLLKKDTKGSNFVFTNKKFFLFFIILSFIFWLNFSPVYRFAVHYFISFIFVITLFFYKKKIFSINIFVMLIMISLIFNFSKNISRISKKDNIYFGIEMIKNEFIDITLDRGDISIYKPNISKNNKNGWQGRLCWDIPFLCSYNKINVDKNYGYLFFSKLNN